MDNQELLRLAYTRELTDERVRVAAAYWLDASPHEQTTADGVILARYARHAMDLIESIQRDKAALIEVLECYYAKGHMDGGGMARTILEQLK